MRPWLRFILILTLVWLGLWGFDRSILTKEEPAQIIPPPTALGPVIPEPVVAPPLVTERSPAAEGKEIPAPADDRPPTPEARPGPIEKPSEISETPSMDEGAPEDLDAGLEEVVEWIEPIGEETLEPDEVESPAPKPPDFLEPGF